MLKTDLARELVRTNTKKIDERIARADLYVDAALSKKTGKPEGRYITIESDVVTKGDISLFPRLSSALSDAIKMLAKGKSRALAVGLGNRLLTADALGVLTIDKLVVENLCGDVTMRTLAPSVVGVTGIESYDVIRGVAEVVKPDVVFAIDSLCAAKVGRIGTSFQLSDAGITPGSGVKNARRPIGVPMVVFASTITLESGGDAELEEDFVVTPKDVDILVGHCADIISSAINEYSANL